MPANQMRVLPVHVFQTAPTNARNFPGTAARQTSFTANASKSNESVTCPRVAGTEVCGCYRGRNRFLPPWKLIFTTVEIDFYHRGN